MEEVEHALRVLPGPDPRGEARIRRRLARSRAERRHRWTRWTAAAALALAACAMLWSQWPAPPRSVALAAEADAPERLLWSDTVDLTAFGRGDVTGRGDNVVVDWEIGALRAKVTPDAGARLTVRADEGQAVGQGTAFDVARDGLGFTVQVSTGLVTVDCADGTAHTLVGPSASVTCWPVTPARLLGRADALTDRGSPLAEVKVTLDRALAHPGLDAAHPLRGELLVRRMQARAGLGEVVPALADAATYVARFAPRRAEVHRFAAVLAIESTADCATAWPHLAALHADPDAALRWLHAECARRRVPGSGDAPRTGEWLAVEALREVSLDSQATEQVRRWRTLLGEQP